MRRSIVLATVIAASTAVFGACSGTAVENKPAENKPVVNSTTTPAVSPTAAPVNGNGQKPANTPEVKKDETKPSTTNVNKDVKPVTNTNATPHK